MCILLVFPLPKEIAACCCQSKACVSPEEYANGKSQSLTGQREIWSDEFLMDRQPVDNGQVDRSIKLILFEVNTIPNAKRSAPGISQKAHENAMPLKVIHTQEKYLKRMQYARISSPQHLTR